MHYVPSRSGHLRPRDARRTFRPCMFKGLPGRRCDPFTSACNDVQLFQAQGGGVSTYTVRIPFGSRRGSARFRRVAAACRSPGKTHSGVRHGIRQTHDHKAFTLLPQMVLTRPQTAMLADTSEAREARTGTTLLRLGPRGRKRLRDLGMVRRRAKSSERVRNRRVEPKRHRGIEDIYARASGTRTAELRVTRS